MLFNNKEKTTSQLLEKVIMLSYWWLKAKCVNFPLGYDMRWKSPFVSLNISWFFTFCCFRWLWLL